jgi:D-arginine dehydrogenase
MAEGPTGSPDAVVIGGGIAGAAAGYFLTASGARVVVLEAEPVLAHHTTGRSAAVYLENYGADPVRRLALASRSFLEAPPDGLAEGPLLSPRGLLEVAGPGLAGLVAEHAQRGAALVPSIRQLTAQEAASVCPVLLPEMLSGAVLEPDATDIDVMGLHQALLRGIRRSGGEVRTRAPVTGVAREGSTWRVETSAGALRAQVVVDAAGAWGDGVATMAGVRPVGLRPLHRTAFIATLPPGMDARGWPLVQDLSDGWYFKPEGDALMCSLADEAPAEPGDPRPRDEDVALALERINDVTTLRLRHVRTAWAGLRTFAPDRVPVIGPEPDAPGFVWVVGLGGFGIMTAPAVGALAAASALGVDLPQSLTRFGLDAQSCGPARLR